MRFCTTDCALALYAENLPLEFLLWQVREHEPDVAREVRSAGEADWGIPKSGNGNLSVRKVEPEKPSGEKKKKGNTRKRPTQHKSQAGANEYSRAEEHIRTRAGVEDCVG